jgi:hypothetical protein
LFFVEQSKHWRSGQQLRIVDARGPGTVPGLNRQRVSWRLGMKIIFGAVTTISPTKSKMPGN